MTNELHDAADDADLDGARRLLRAGAKANARDDYGRTPLACALSARKAAHDREIAARIAIATLLLEHGADPSLRDGEGRSALWHALALGPIGKKKGKRIVARIMRAKPNLTSADHEGYSILHMATIYGYEDVVAAALRAHARVDARDEDGGTPLFHAAFYGSLPIARRLLGAKANPNARAKDGRTPVHVAATAGDLRILRELVRRGGDLRAKNADGYTPLELAAWMKHGDVVRFLLSKRAPGPRALHLLAEMRFSQGRREGTSSYGKIAQLLLAAGVDPDGKDEKKRTPLQAHLARRRPHQAVVRALVAAGADLDVLVKPEGANKAVRARTLVAT